MFDRCVYVYIYILLYIIFMCWIHILHAYKYICILYIFVAHLLARANGTSTSGPTQSLQKVTGLPSFSYARSIQIYASYIMIMIHIIWIKCIICILCSITIITYNIYDRYRQISTNINRYRQVTTTHIDRMISNFYTYRYTLIWKILQNLKSPTTSNHGIFMAGIGLLQDLCDWCHGELLNLDAKTRNFWHLPAPAVREFLFTSSCDASIRSAKVRCQHNGLGTLLQNLALNAWKSIEQTL